MPDKWEREIEELLRDKFSEDEPTPLRPYQRNRQRPQKRQGGGNDLRRLVNSLSGERLVLYGVGCALAAYLFRPFFGQATLLLVLASVACIAAAVVVSVLQHENPYIEKRWRGQVVKMPRQSRPVSFTWYRLRANLRRWLNRWR